MKPVLILQHLSDDGPAYLATWLARQGLPFEVRNTEAGDAFDPEVAYALHRFIYASGNSLEPGNAYASFRGRSAKVEPLLRKRGLLPEPA